MRKTTLAFTFVLLLTGFGCATTYSSQEYMQHLDTLWNQYESQQLSWEQYKIKRDKVVSQWNGADRRTRMSSWFLAVLASGATQQRSYQQSPQTKPIVTPTTSPQTIFRPFFPAGNAYNNQGQFVGYIDSQGTITNSHGHMTGRIKNDGTIIDTQGHIQGHIDQEGTISNDQGIQGRVY